MANMKTSDQITAGSMTATPAERRRYAENSRKWNSTQNPKFVSEFPDEHAANLEWIKKGEEEQKRLEQERLRQQQQQNQHSKWQGETQPRDNMRDASGMRKWVMIGVIGILVALKAWQRYKQHVVE